MRGFFIARRQRYTEQDINHKRGTIMCDTCSKFSEFDSRATPEAGNLVVSYSVADDRAAEAAGFRFLGVARDSQGAEIHLFEMQPLHQS